MSGARRDISRRIVDAIVADIIDRQGIGDAWESIDEGIRDEIISEWRSLIEAELP